MQSWLCFSNLNINLSFGVSLNEISFASNKINTARRSIIKEKFNIKLKSSFYTEFRIREFFQFFFFFLTNFEVPSPREITFAREFVDQIKVNLFSDFIVRHCDKVKVAFFIGFFHVRSIKYEIQLLQYSV